MKYLKLPIFWFPCLLFGLHQLLQYGLGWKIPWVDSYLDPILAMPIVLGIVRSERRWFFGVNGLSYLEIAVITVAMIVIFELIFPIWESRFVRDWWDVPGYLAGSLLFIWARSAGAGEQPT